MGLDLLTNIGFAIAGFLAKFLLERYSKHRDAIRLESWKMEAANLEQKISQLFWPLHCRLQRGAISWETENFRNHSKDKHEFVSTFDREVIIRNHEETRDIIQTNFHHFGGDRTLEAELIKLLHHIDVYLALRAVGSKNDPIWVGQPWPSEVNRLVEEHLHSLQKRYDSILSQAQSPI